MIYYINLFLTTLFKWPISMCKNLAGVERFFIVICPSKPKIKSSKKANFVLFVFNIASPSSQATKNLPSVCHSSRNGFIWIAVKNSILYRIKLSICKLNLFPQHLGCRKQICLQIYRPFIFVCAYKFAVWCRTTSLSPQALSNVGDTAFHRSYIMSRYIHSVQYYLENLL